MCERCDEINHNGDKPAISGSQFGIDFYDLPYESDGKQHRNPQFRIFSEDDTYWHFTGCRASVLWISDLIKVLQEAARHYNK